MNEKPPVLVLAGPTAVGKTALAIELAQRLEADIISADSRQVYRHLNIGTAKPTEQEQRQAKHHLIDILEPGQPYSAGQFARDARQTMSTLEAAGRGYIVVGGSGLYLRALIDGFSEMPPVSLEIRQRLRSEIEQRGIDAIYRRLKKYDRETADRLKPSDRDRILRALEVLEGTGRSISYWQSQPRKGDGRRYLLVVLDRKRAELYRRIEERTEQMISSGLLEEVRHLVAFGFKPALEVVKAVGYREALDFLDGRIDFGSMAEAIKMNTRRFAKRQLTWFRGMARARWLEVEEGSSTVEKILSMLTEEAV